MNRVTKDAVEEIMYALKRYLTHLNSNGEGRVREKIEEILTDLEKKYTQIKQ